MSFVIPTLDDEHEFMIALMRNLLSDYKPDVSQGSFNWLWLRTISGAATDNHAHIDSVENDLLPDTAPDDGMLDRWGTLLGIVRKGATPARKDAALRVFGNVAAPVPNGQQLSHVSGLVFAINGATAIGAGGYVDANVVAVSTGSATRLNAGEQMTFISTPAGLQDTAELQLNMDQDGTDLETPDAYRSRMLTKLSDPPLGGAQADYVAWALQTTGIAAAFCYPARQGLGSVDVAALHAGSGQARVLLGGEVTALQTAIAALKPVAVTLRVLTVVTRAIDIEYTVLPDGSAQSAFDWDDSLAPVVLAYTAATHTLQFQGGSRPADIVPGMRITLKPALGGGTGQQYVVAALGGTADTIILESDPSPAPANNDVVYSGGALVDTIRTALQALVDGLGTANPDASRYGTWDGNLRPGAIDRVAREVIGVLDGTVVAPGAIATATDFAFPSDGNIELLIAGRILVRRAH